MRELNLTFFLMQDLTVLGSNPENADFDNPRGELIGTSTYLVGEDEYGARIANKTVALSFKGSPRSKFSGESLQALANRLNDGDYRKSDLVPEQWENIDPRYGSEAYISDQPFMVYREMQEAILQEEAFPF